MTSDHFRHYLAQHRAKRLSPFVASRIAGVWWVWTDRGMGFGSSLLEAHHNATRGATQ
jgi:hypothetical protein